MKDRDSRRSDIMDCAKELFALKGYHNTSINDIIAKAQIARGTFYLYFDSKRSVFFEIIDSAVEQILSGLRPVKTGPNIGMDSILSQLRINLSHAMSPMFNDIYLAKLVSSQAESLDTGATEKVTAFYRNIIDWLEESLDEGQELSIVRPLNSRITAVALVGMLKGIIWSYAIGGEMLDFHELVEELTANVTRGIMVKE
ncbi:MAG: TetR/AcrR family transcriptional regulator [Deltaproteobacteria bacterium]|nr:TetR/AcrR family transcriptional regulator [Deltaproteobacteria bacterium]